MERNLIIGSVRIDEGGSILRNERRWDKEDIVKYIIIVYYLYQREILLKMLSQSKWTFYKCLSVFIQNKNANQCRIFHLSMLRKYQNYQNLFRFELLEKDKFLELCQLYQTKIKRIIYFAERPKYSARRESQYSQFKQILNIEQLQGTSTTIDFPYPGYKSTYIEGNNERDIVLNPISIFFNYFVNLQMLVKKND